MMDIASGSVVGLYFCGGAGISYVMESAVKWVIICVSGKGPIYGVGFWYQFGSGVTIMVIVFGSCLAANLAQWMACWVVSRLWVCAYPMPVHLYSKALPRDPKILSREKGEKYFVILVEHVIGDEKYE